MKQAILADPVLKKYNPVFPANSVIINALQQSNNCTEVGKLLSKSFTGNVSVDEYNNVIKETYNDIQQKIYQALKKRKIFINPLGNTFVFDNTLVGEYICPEKTDLAQYPANGYTWGFKINGKQYVWNKKENKYILLGQSQELPSYQVIKTVEQHDIIYYRVYKVYKNDCFVPFVSSHILTAKEFEDNEINDKNQTMLSNCGCEAIICEPFNDIQIYGNCEVLHTTLTELGGTTDATAEAFDYKDAHLVPAKCKDGTIIGYHVFWFDFRRDKPVLQIGKDKLEEFRNNFDIYRTGSGLYYVNGEPSEGMKLAAAGSLSGNWSLYWEGLKQEWKECLTNFDCAAIVGLSSVNGVLSMFRSKIPNTTFTTTANNVAKFTTKEVDDLTDLATKQNGNNKVMLGKYDGGGSTGYKARSGKDHTYFDLGDKWDDAANLVAKNDNEMWRINEKFLNNQKSMRKEFYFSHDPFIEASKNTFMGREVRYFGIENIKKNK